jgi:3-hydroxyisobutyrate dehydrogenase
MRIAVLGTGVMGAPMARNLAAAGHEVRAWNRTRERAEPLAEAGVTVAATPEAAAADAELVTTMVTDAAAVEAIAGSLDGAFAEDAVWWQASTVGVAATERLIERAQRAGVPLVDAPVLGTKQPAEEGTLTVLASGPAAARERCAPAFDAVAARVVDLGDEPGVGTKMKLVVNAWLLALTEGLAESVLLAEGLGVDPATFLDIIDGGPMGPPYAKLKGTMMVDRAYPPSFALAVARKDAGLVEDAARAAGVDLPLPRVIGERMQSAMDAGHGADDMAATVEAGRRQR